MIGTAFLTGLILIAPSSQKVESYPEMDFTYQGYSQEVNAHVYGGEKFNVFVECKKDFEITKVQESTGYIYNEYYDLDLSNGTQFIYNGTTYTIKTK